MFNVLLDLEWGTDINEAITCIDLYFTSNDFSIELFGKILMREISPIYGNCSDIKDFGRQMYILWESLPAIVQPMEPFLTLCYADKPLSRGDEDLTRNNYKNMLSYYEEQPA